MIRKERYKKIIDHFNKNMPVAETELVYTNPYQFIVAVILSAQCTDKRVNLTTPFFFKKFPTAQSLAKSSPEKIFPLIKSISYPNNKAKYLVDMARMLIKKFSEIVPSSVNELQKLPGVGRKSANVIASVIYQKPVMPVDTHVFRVSARIGLTLNAKNPFQAEKQLVKYIPKEKIPIAHHWLILHGRYVCTARKPICEKCGIKFFCKYYENINSR
ncbi:MAG: endonuclease III [Bacteroidota bacterium]